jgi:hypothetical protein
MSIVQKTSVGRKNHVTSGVFKELVQCEKKRGGGEWVEFAKYTLDLMRL